MNLPEINDGHYLEVMDRIHVAVSMIDEHILSHPLLEHHPLIQDEVGEAIEKLLTAYQKVGSILP